MGTIEKTGNGWQYKNDEPSKAWYKIQVTPLNENEEPFVFKVETHDIDWTMEQYQRNREPFHWKMLDWNVRV